MRIATRLLPRERKTFFVVSVPFVGCLIALLAVIGCDETVPPKKPVGSHKLKIVTTVGMLTDIVRHVAGARAEVQGLINTGVDPHLYRSTPDDLKIATEADVVFYVGLRLEGPMEDGFRAGAAAGKPIFAVTDALAKSMITYPGEFSGHPDPHVWNDVSLWSQCVGEVAKRLSEFDPPHAAEYQSNAQAYQQELQELDDYVRACVATVPQEQRYLITATMRLTIFRKPTASPCVRCKGSAPSLNPAFETSAN